MVDETGLQDRYDLTLDFMPDERWPGFSGWPHTSATDSIPDVFEAIKDQLGLQFEAGKATVSILVVDSADKVPPDN